MPPKRDRASEFEIGPKRTRPSVGGQADIAI